MKKVFVFLGAVFAASSVFALDTALKITPAMYKALDADYGSGFGGFAQFDADLFGLFTAGVEVNAASVTPEGIYESMTFAGAGAGLGVYYFPFAHLYLGAGGAAGLYQVSTKINSKNESASDYYWRGYAEIGYRFTPEMTLAASGGYISYNVTDNDPYNYITAGLTLRYTMSIGKSGSSAFNVNLEQDEPAFPLFMSAYQSCPLGTLTIRNNEGAEIKNVHVSFRAGKYTKSTFESVKVGRINKHSSKEVPLYADFSSEILRFAEDGKISGELVVDYEFLGKKKTAVQSCVISVHNRNAFSWGDSNALAAFVDSNNTDILKFAKEVSGTVNGLGYAAMNKNVQMAAGIMEALRLAGVKYSEDKVTPYTSFRNGEELDSIQYPLQTMNVLSGDYDDLGILVASCLESIGVGTGFLPMEDDFVVLVNLKIKPENASSHFADTNALIIDDQTAWFGLSMKAFEKGFSASRRAAAAVIKKANSAAEGTYEFVNVEDAWTTYAAAAFEGNGSVFETAAKSSVEKAVKAAIQDYINSDMEKVVARARASGDANKIGMALARSGRYAEARSAFAQSNSISAMHNLANIYMIERNYSAAAAQYKKILAKAPGNKSAARGLSKAEYFAL